MARIFREERTGSTIRLDSSPKHKTTSSAAMAKAKMNKRQQRDKASDIVPRGMSSAEYARQKMLMRMLTPPKDRI